jgi:hypothetical protein
MPLREPPPKIVRPKLDPYWVGWLGLQFANRPDLKPPEISELAKVKAREVGRSDPPARATTYKYFDLYQAMPEHIREGYRQFVWPDAMENGSLPWEASRVSLDLLDWAEKHSLTPPTVAITEWFWRATLALPGTPLGLRLRVAVTLATHKEADRPIPADLQKWVAGQAVPPDFRARVINGGASAVWAADLGVRVAFDPGTKASLYGENPDG